MKKTSNPIRLCILWLMLHFEIGASADLVFKTLVSFSGTNGAQPNSSLLLARDGNLYGTTIQGGTSNFGTVFKVSTGGVLSTVFEFSSDTGSPGAGLAHGKDGNLYGTTVNGGDSNGGTAFLMTTNGEFTILASFDDTSGTDPNALIQAHDGNLYGTARQGGANGYGQYGTIFRLSRDGHLKTLYSFGSQTNENEIGLDGQVPGAALVEGSDDALYGTTTFGGTHAELGGFGTVFRITTNGMFTSLVSFDGTNGAFPEGPLVEGVDGTFWGTTPAGGFGFSGPSSLGNGTIFKVTKSGSLTTLHYFSGYPNDGANPQFVGLTPGTDGTWFGTTDDGGSHNSGTAFRLTAEGELSVIYSFAKTDFSSTTNLDGVLPAVGLTQGVDGNLYGVTSQGGAYGAGIVFCFINSAFSQPLIQTIQRTNATTVVTWKPLPGRRYQLQSKDDLGQPIWMNIGGVVSSTESTATANDTRTSVPSRIYRLVLLP